MNGADDRRWLRGLSPLYGFGARLAGVAYDRGWRRIHRATCPVLSVGNLAVGGTGKTPVTRYLASECLRRGRRPAILLRGYRARGALDRVPADLAPGMLPTFGDEGLSHARALPDAIVIAHPNRVRAAAVAEKLGADILLLDDGFQHRRLARDVDLVLLDWESPLGRGGLLPGGDLREPISALGRADGVGWTRYRATVTPPAQQRDEIRAARSASAVHPDVRWQFSSGGVSRLTDGKPFGPRRVVLVTGVARPASVVDTARESGLDVLEHVRFADHHTFTAADLQTIEHLRLRTGADGLVVTEKDAVRLIAADAPLRIEKGIVGVLSLRCEPLDPLDSIWQTLGV